MLATYGIIFFALLLFVIIGIYFISTYIMPRKIEEIQKMIETGQIKLAIKKLNDLLEKDERNPLIHYLLAEAYIAENNIRYAVPEYRQVLKIGKYDDKIKEASIRLKLARIYKERNAVEEAKKEYLILTQIDSHNYESFYELGRIFFNAGTYDKAISFLKKSISLNKNHDPSYYHLGQVYYRRENFQEAKQMFIQAIKIDQANYKAHYFLGLALRMQGDYEWAIKEFEIAEKDIEIKVKCFLAKGTCYLEHEQLPRAIMEFGKGLKFAKRGSDTELNLLYFLANAQELTRDLHSAILNWEKIVEVKKNFRDVQDKLKKYDEFRQDDQVKDFLIAGLSKFEHTCRKLAEIMGYTVVDVKTEELEIELLVTEEEGKWMNIRKSHTIIKIIRDIETIHDHLLRKLHESMKPKNATKVIIITAGNFSQSATDFSNTRPIDLLGKDELITLLKKIQK